MTVNAFEHAVTGPLAWPAAPSEIRLEEHDVHIWCAWLDDVDEDRSRLGAVLSADERARAAKFRLVRDRVWFMTARRILRQLLARYLDQAPASIAFSSGRFGKPEIAQGRRRRPVRFNVSRSGALAVYAVTWTGLVGVDVERVRDISDINAIASRYFCPDETAHLLALPEDRRRDEFFACWTRTEAFLKASGEGIGQVRNTCAPFGWQLRQLSPTEGYVGAVACRLGACLSLWSVSKESLCR